MSADKGVRDNSHPSQDAELEHDLATMTPDGLRQKYRLEANSHRAMMARGLRDGFEIDPTWRTFKQFLADMGRRDSTKYTIDRIDGSRRFYGPGACRWADKKTQSENRSNVQLVAFGDDMITTAEFSRRTAIPRSTAYAKLAKGLSPDEIVGRRSSDRYRPERFTTDTEVDAWYASYKRQLSRLPKVYHSDLPPVMFDIAIISSKLKGADDWLDAHGFYQLAGEETQEADRLLKTRGNDDCKRRRLANKGHG